MTCKSPHKTASHHKHLSAEARKKISLALKGKKHAHKGHAVSLETKRKISEALKCHYATHGTCYKPHRPSAHREAKRLQKKLHDNPLKGKKCPANKSHRRDRVTKRKASHIHRHVMRSVRKGQRHYRKTWLQRWEHLAHTRPHSIEARVIRLDREWKKRERALHQARLHCHTAHRKMHHHKMKTRPACPRGQRKRQQRSRLDRPLGRGVRNNR